MRNATVCFLLRQMPTLAVLLGYKKVRFGAGKYAGVGGGVEAGETVVAAACREVAEEMGVAVQAHHLQSRGIVRFRFPAQPAWDQQVTIFVTTTWDGEPSESEEMRPVWFPHETVPWTAMWDDSRYWLPHVLEGQSVQFQITFAEDNATVVKVEKSVVP